MLEQETVGEMELIRRGEDVALARINHLKATNAAHERNLALLTASLAAQSEMLHDVRSRVAVLTRSIPSPQSLQQLEQQQQQQQPRSQRTQQQQQQQQQQHSWVTVAAALHQLNSRLQKGVGPQPPQ